MSTRAQQPSSTPPQYAYAAQPSRTAIHVLHRPPLQQLTVTELRERLEQVAALREAQGVVADHPDAEIDEGPQLIDVREESEVRIDPTMGGVRIAAALRTTRFCCCRGARHLPQARMAALPFFELLPTSRFPEWAATIDQQLDPRRETIVLCHHGVRSMHVAQFLVQQKGFSHVLNVTGGIDAYSIEADPSVPRY